MDSRFTRFIQFLLLVGRFRQEEIQNEIDRSMESAAQESWKYQLTRVFFNKKMNLTEAPSSQRTEEKKGPVQCPICLDYMMSYKEGHICNTSIVVMTAKCAHKFHLNHQKEWFNHSCPLSRSAVEEGCIDI